MLLQATPSPVSDASLPLPSFACLYQETHSPTLRFPGNQFQWSGVSEQHLCFWWENSINKEEEKEVTNLVFRSGVFQVYTRFPAFTELVKLTR